MNIANNFLDKDFAGAIGNVISLGLKILFGNRSASVSQKRDYTVGVGDLGGVVRIDYLIYVKQFSS